MSRLIVIGSVAAASAVLLTGTAAAVGMVAAKSQPTVTASTTRVSVVAPAAAVKNDKISQAINAASPSAKPSALPTIKVKPIKVHPRTSGNGTSAPRVIITYKTTKPTTGHKKTIIVTITETPTPSASPSSTHHEDGGHDGGDHHHGSHSPSPSASPSTHGGGDD